jgi:hypothetical protein
MCGHFTHPKGRTMKNKAFLPALTLVAASALMSACGGGGDDDGPGTPEPVVVIVTTPFSVSMRINTSNGTRSWRYAAA